MASSTHAVEMSGIRKSFGGIKALQGVDFQVDAGSVHALMGENGAGKSTLLKVLQGVWTPDDGTVSVLGSPMNVFTPEAARCLGVGMIFQELSLIPTLTVSQNIFLSCEPRMGKYFIDDRKAVADAGRLLSELGLDIDPRTPVSKLSTGEMQMTEIAKAVSQNARVLILDEPTSALSTAEVDHLFSIVRRLSASGVAIVYVSHRMDEIYQIAQQVTVLRDGKRVITGSLKELSVDHLVEHMVGKRVHSFNWVQRKVDRSRPPVLELENVHGKVKPNGVSLKLYPGEVLGIAGLLGSGRSEMARLIFGIDQLKAGEIRLKGAVAHFASPRQAMANGIGLIPESRAREGLITSHKVSENLSLPRIDQLKSGFFLDAGKEAEEAKVLVERLRVKTASIDAPARTLSGGNQQKLVLGKWIATEPDVIILDEPTAGVDIGSKGEIVEIIRGLADEGKAVLLISSELAELLAVSDRILIMSNGRIGQEVLREDIGANKKFKRQDVPEEAVGIAAAEHALQVMIQEVRIHATRH